MEKEDNNRLKYSKRNDLQPCTSRTIKKLILLTMTVILSVGVYSCGKNDFENKKTIKKLYKMYKNGDISECKHNGETVYCAGINAYDAEGIIYDKNGKQIGCCNYFANIVDPICNQLTDCKIIYRVANNIQGEPAVDIYGLGK